MRKSSAITLKEIKLEIAIGQLNPIDKKLLNSSLHSLLTHATDELKAFNALMDLSNKNIIIAEYVNNKIIDHTKNVMAQLGIATTTQFEEGIEELEKQWGEYGEIRNSIKPTIH